MNEINEWKYKNDQYTASPHLTHLPNPTTCIVEMMGTPEPTHGPRAPNPPPPPPPILHQNTILPHQISHQRNENDCFILIIRMSKCSLQPVTWELYKFRWFMLRGRLLNYLLKSSATINRYPTLQLVGVIQLIQILQTFVKAIFDEPTEITNWPSSQRNLNVLNEGVFGTQLGKQYYKMVQFVLFVFHVVILDLCLSRIAKLPVQYSNRPTTAWRLESH